MAINIPTVNVGTDVWGKLISTVNLLANVVSNSVLTIGSNTTGDSGVTNNFFANTFISNYLNTNVINANSLSISTVSNLSLIAFGNNTVNLSINSSSIILSNPSSNIIINVPNTAQIANGQYFLNANGTYSTVTTVSYPILTGIVNSKGRGIQTIDTWPYGLYNVANYNLFVIDNTANNFYTSRMTMLFSSNNVTITEYAQMTTNTSVGIFGATTDSNNVILNFNPVSSNTTIKFFRECT